MSNSINAHVSWSGKNFSASIDNDFLGAIIVTHKKYNELIKELNEAIDFQVEGLIEDGEKLPEYIVKKNYKLNFDYTTAALLQRASEFTSLKAIASESGINEQLISHYANDLKKPRAIQKEKIIEGIRKIQENLFAVANLQLA